MDTIRKLLSHLGEYRRPTLIAPMCTLVAVGMEVLIPYIIAMLIDQGISKGDMGKVWVFGGIMLACAFVSLMIDSASAVFGSRASTGLASNLRDALFEKVQNGSIVISNETETEPAVAIAVDYNA